MTDDDKKVLESEKSVQGADKSEKKETLSLILLTGCSHASRSPDRVVFECFCNT